MTLFEIKTLLTSKSETLAVAESLTCGTLQAMIGSISGASNFFKGGITTYQEESKVKLLGVDQHHAHSVNCVSQHVANQMAEGVCTLFGSDRGLATTGYAESWGEVTTPYAYYAIAFNNEVVSGGRIDGNTTMSRVQMQQFVCTEVLERFTEKL